MGARSQSRSAVPAPRWVGRYEIVRPIARGGMAEVYLARTRPVAGVERLFAIKCCHPHLRDDHEFASMFIEEARLAAQIRHPNVVATFDVGDEEMLYLVMEYVEGEPLSELIKAARRKGERLPLAVTLRIAADALAGLHAAHETRDGEGRPLGVVHRDVSPQNILVGLDGVARIVDFGIAKAEASATVTREGQVKGKLAYLPPEQLREHVMTRRGDVYAMGVVLWETLTSQRLFRGQNAGEIALKVLEKKVDAPSTAMDQDRLFPRLDEAVLRALERDPQRRFATAADLASALESCGAPMASHREVGELVAGVHAARAGEVLDHDRPQEVPTPPTMPVLTRYARQAGGPGTRRTRWTRPARLSLLAVVTAAVLGGGAALVARLSGNTAAQRGGGSAVSLPVPTDLPEPLPVNSLTPSGAAARATAPSAVTAEQPVSPARGAAAVQAAPMVEPPMLGHRPVATSGKSSSRGSQVSQSSAASRRRGNARRVRAGASVAQPTFDARPPKAAAVQVPAGSPAAAPSEFRPGGV